MNIFAMVVLIFGIGAMFGWALEVFYRHFADREKDGLTQAFVRRIILFLLIAICLTLIELIAGIMLLKFFNMRLWDYAVANGVNVFKKQ